MARKLNYYGSINFTKVYAKGEKKTVGLCLSDTEAQKLASSLLKASLDKNKTGDVILTIFKQQKNKAGKTRATIVAAEKKNEKRCI